jgi:adenosylcobinamide kinase/adenosylcobinamide-phosphate guanylyltransferase
LLVFISGGVRSGKSSLGEKLAAGIAGENRKIYLATAKCYDREIAERIRVHQRNRADKGFLTIDKHLLLGDIVPFLQAEDTVLLDCLGTLLANEMYEKYPDGESDPESAYQRITADLEKLKDKVANLLVISNEVFSDGIIYEDHIELYIRNLAKLHIKLAKESDLAIECVYAGYQCHKGTVPSGWK